MGKAPVITPQRAAEVYEEVLSVRRDYCADNEFFKMTDFWEHLCEESDAWRIKTYRSGKMEDFARRAAVINFEDRVTLTVDETLWADAKKGKLFYNFMLAHEVGHLILDHHSAGAVTKNFQLYGAKGTHNLPPTSEELETNYAAVFLQCGTTLMEPTWSDLQLARIAYSDRSYITKARMASKIRAFQDFLVRPKPKWERIVF